MTEVLRSELADGVWDVDAFLTALKNAAKPISFLVGAPLSTSEGKGVPDVNAMIDLIRSRLKDRQISGLEKIITGAPASATYQTAMNFTLGRTSQAFINELIKEAVLQAYRQPDGPESGDGKPENWVLPPGTKYLGKLITNYPEKFGPILTTNFDPLLSLSIRAAGAQAQRRILGKDGVLLTEAETDSGAHQVVHLHGYWRGADTLHTNLQLRSKRSKLRSSLQNLIKRHTLAVVAYGGWDDVFTEALTELVLAEERIDVMWSFYERTLSAIKQKHGKLLKKIEPALSSGRFRCYTGVDCHHVFRALFSLLQDDGNKKSARPDGEHSKPLTSTPNHKGKLVGDQGTPGRGNHYIYRPDNRPAHTASGVSTEPLLILRINVKDEGISYELAGHDLRFKQTIQGDVQKIVNKQYAGINEWLTDAYGHAQFDSRLSGIGRDLCKMLFPPGLAWHLWKLWTESSPRCPALLICTNESFIPWEMIRLINPATGENSQRPLCEIFALSRWFGDNPSPRIIHTKHTALVDGNTSELGGEDRKHEIFELLNGVPRTCTKINPEARNVLGLLHSNYYDLWHISSRNSADNVHPEDYSLQLRTSTIVHRELCQISQLAGNPLVISLVCNSKGANSSINRFDLLAEALIHLKASAFVGSRWTTRNRYASRFGIEFYQRFFDRGLPIAEAFRQARLEVRRKIRKDLNDDSDGSWLSYVLFAHPLATYRASSTMRHIH